MPSREGSGGKTLSGVQQTLRGSLRAAQGQLNPGLLQKDPRLPPEGRAEAAPRPGELLAGEPEETGRTTHPLDLAEPRPRLPLGAAGLIPLEAS